MALPLGGFLKVKHKFMIQPSGRNINKLRNADDTTLMAESEEELKSLLMRVKEESGKASLKHNIQKTRIMVSGPITFGGLKITADGDCSHEIKRHLLLGRKVMINLAYSKAETLFC